MSTPYIGEVRMVAFNFAPKGWALCNGQSMPINQNQPLFALLGITYGGDGRTTFALPDFRGRAPAHSGRGQQPGSPNYQPGQVMGEEFHTLQVAEMPAHNHVPMASSANNTLGSPSNNYWATGPAQFAAAPDNTQLAGNAIAAAGNSQGHENRSPYLVISFVIALTGIFPSPN